MSPQKNDMAEFGLEDFYFFARGIIGKDYMTPELHEPLCRFLQLMEILRKIIVLPRSFLKSTLGCIVLPIWLSLHNPDIRILIVCNIIENAMNHLRQIKSIFETNDVFRSLYPWIIPNIRKVMWSDHSVEVKRTMGWGEATFNAAGLGTNIVSTH